MTKENLLKNGKKLDSRIVARGEITDHAHIITGDAEVYDVNGETFILAKGNDVKIRHLLESAFKTGQEVWTKEHHDIDLEKDQIYKYVQQVQFDPYEKKINEVRD